MKALRAGVVGLKMGMAHFNAMNVIENYEVVAVCDINPTLIDNVVSKNNTVKGFTDFDKMLAEMNLDVLAIATPNNLHAPMVIKAAHAGLKGIACEKPISMDLEEAYEMQSACEKNNVKLIVLHQRRMSAPYTTMKRLVDEGAIGQVFLVRGNCAGDILSDGTHTVDSVNFLLSDPKPINIMSQIHRDLTPTAEHPHPGVRFGHPVESGGMTIVYFENNIRFELFTGDLAAYNWNLDVPGNAYQDIEIVGTTGRLWRNGDSPKADLRLWDQNGGWTDIASDPYPFASPHDAVYKEFYLNITENKPHTLSVENALKTQEIIMGAYESARLRKQLQFPIEQKKFPLQLMVDDGKI